MSTDIATANDKPRSNLVDVPPEKRKGFMFDGTWRSWDRWAFEHALLGQALARGMREYPGPTTDDDGGDIGGTPVLMRVAA